MKPAIIKIDKKQESGFTLIEVLVALAIFSIVIVGVIEVFVNSNKSYMMQDDIASMQQNIRIAKMFIERDVRMADASFVFENGVGEGGSDKLTMGYVESLDNACGEDPDPTDDIDRPCSELSTLHLKGDMPESSSVANVYEDLSGEASDWEEGCYCGGETYDSPQYGFQAIIETPKGYDPAVSDIFYLTGVNANKLNQLINHPVMLEGEDGKNEKFDNKIINAYPDKSIINFYIPESRITTSYEIKDGELLRGDQLIADNVEDLQFAFCGDFDNDGIVDPENTNDWFNGELEEGDLPADSKILVRYVRITLLGRTSKQHQISDTRPSIEDNAQADTQDKFNRRLLQTTVQMRNASL
ncbi:Prepilin-type cleavage/methylation domain-containing protein [Desulfonema limicola]|uniref:Prepilin-type cleavage/methylation domain-containing protein n=2 Tax=Desulfonema limicola TaxID=45656 RepID=A0A975GJ45_9BACT|nr:Prepilin-type cleavage/methylation domain-containing protein [Desulfonema limicola]